MIFNGSLLGKKNAPSLNSATGIWKLNEIHIARTVNEWKELEEAPTHSSFLSSIESQGYTAASGQDSITSAGNYIVSGISATGTMWGTPWGTHYTNDSAANRIVQHAVNNETTFNWIVANSSKVLLTIVSLGSNPTHISLSRNGYTSESYAAFAANYCTQIVFWDDSDAKAYEANPYNSSAYTKWSL